MILTSCLLITLSLTSLLLLTTSPLPLGAIILFLALRVSLLFTTLSSSWFRITIFLIYVGGLLVIFIYFAALAPNTQISLRHTLPIITFIISLSFPIIVLFNPIISATSLFPPLLKNITILFTPTNIYLLLFLSLLLFFILIAVVKISSLTAGPLRPFLKYV